MPNWLQGVDAKVCTSHTMLQKFVHGDPTWTDAKVCSLHHATKVCTWHWTWIDAKVCSFHPWYKSLYMVGEILMSAKVCPPHNMIQMFVHDHPPWSNAKVCSLHSWHKSLYRYLMQKFAHPINVYIIIHGHFTWMDAKLFSFPSHDTTVCT